MTAPPTPSGEAPDLREAVARTTVRCDDCEGTGAEAHDCWLCKGERYIAISDAIAEGYAEDELEQVEENEASCPSCHGETCELCEGSGKVDADLPSQQEDRVLICAMTRGMRIPPLFRVGHSGKIWRDNDSLLSPSAAERLSEKGQLYRLQILAFGDDISLQGDGHAEAKLAWRRHRARWKQWIACERQKRAAHRARSAMGGTR